MYSRKYTPERINELMPNELFVFGSNLMGQHAGGAACIAREQFGAVWGQGVGLQGQSYAIPTMQGGADTIKPYVDELYTTVTETRSEALIPQGPQPKNLDIRHGDTGYSYDNLFAAYLDGAKEIELQEPYLSNGYQLQNLTRFAETVVKVGTCKSLKLITKICDTVEEVQKVQEGLEQLKAALADVGVDFEYTFSDGIHARYIMTDTGWNISLDRGLHIYQPVAKNYYLMGYYDLDLRPCKETKIIYTKVR